MCEEIFIDILNNRTSKVPTEKISNSISQFCTIEISEYNQPQIIETSSFNTISPKEQVIVCFFVNELLWREKESVERFVSVQTLFEDFPLDSSTHYPYIRELEQDGIIERKNPDKYSLKSKHLSTAFSEL